MKKLLKPIFYISLVTLLVAVGYGFWTDADNTIWANIALTAIEVMVLIFLIALIESD